MAEAALEGVVAAGVEDDEVHAVLSVRHLVEQASQRHGLIAQVVLHSRIRVHGKHVVLPASLNPVPGIKENPNAPFAEFAAELGDGTLHLTLPGVLECDHLEAEALEGALHRVRVVDRIGEFSGGFVVRVANHQRVAACSVRSFTFDAALGTKGRKRESQKGKRQ